MTQVAGRKEMSTRTSAEAFNSDNLSQVSGVVSREMYGCQLIYRSQPFERKPFRYD